MAIASLTKKKEKVSLNIKVSPEPDARLKEARALARQKGVIFNVSLEVEKYLSKKVEKVISELKEI